MGRVRADNPQAANLPAQHAVQDFVIGPAWLGGNEGFGNLQHARDLAAIFGIGEIVAAQQVVVLLNSREPIALHWPVIELAPVPGRPMLPVIRARLMMAW